MKLLSRLALFAGAFLFACQLIAQAPPRGGAPGGGGGRPTGGGGGYHGGGGNRGGGGGYRNPGGYYGGGYRGGYRGGYYRPYGGWGRPYYAGWGGWGWGWGAGWGWGFPGYWGGYYGVPGGYVGAGYVGAMQGAWGLVKTDVSPEEARLFLDGRYIGLADDFDGFPDVLYLQPGDYHLEFQLDGFETLPVDLKSRAGEQVRIDQKLKKVPGAKQYGSYDTPEPEGGVQRFWGKSKDKTVPESIDVEAGDAGIVIDWRDRDGQPQAPPAAAPAPPPEAAPVNPSAASAPPAPPSTRGRIRFRIEPGDAAVYLDDRFVGTAEELSTLSRGLQVSPGAHKVVVSRPGYDSEGSQVVVEGGATEQVEITLQRP